MNLNIFKSKNILASLVLAGMALTSVSCSDNFLNTSDPNQPSSSSFWASENDAMIDRKSVV